MIQFAENGTAHTTSFLTDEEVSEAVDETAEKMLEFTKQSMKSQEHFGKSILSDYAPVAQNLAKEYENLDNDYVLEIVKLFSTFTDRETSDTNFDVCRVALDASIKTDEVYLMETMFENNLESLSRGGIKIFEIDGGLDIRNKGVEKHLSHEDREKIEEHLVGTSDNDGFDDFLDGGVDISGQNIKVKGAKTTTNDTTVGYGAKADNLTVNSLELELEERDEMKGVMTSGNY